MSSPAPAAASDSWPAALAGLPVCPKRRLPIPYSTAREPDGTGRFEVNDTRRKIECGRGRLCGVCGKPLGWWVVFLAEDHGTQLRRIVFTDAPLDQDCAEASLAVCPYIARPRVPRRDTDDAAAPTCFDPGAPKRGWLMLVTHSYEMVRQPGRGGGLVIGFRPGSAVRIRRFGYGTDGTLTEVTP